MKILRFALAALLFAACGLAPAGPSQVGGKMSPDGQEEIQLDLPGQEHMKNTGGKDGSGLCVFTSIELAAHWQHVEDLRGFQEKMTHEQGGGWPDKVDDMMKKYAPQVQYLQYSGSDPSTIRLCLKTGRMACITYGSSPRYPGKISHMVDCVHFSDKWAAVLDNNFPGEDKYEWMAPDELLGRWKEVGGGWVIVLLSGNPPPPIPVNGRSRLREDDTCCSCCKHCSCGCQCRCRQTGRACCKCCPCRSVKNSPRTTHHSPPHQTTILFQLQLFFRLDIFNQDLDDAPDALQDFGVSHERMPAIQQGETFYSVNGQRISALEAFRLIQKGGALTDDSTKQRLTIIGTSDEVAPVLKDLDTHPALLSLRAGLQVNTYPPDHWAVAGVGLPHDGHPTIILQSQPDSRGRGRVLHIQRDYDGPDALAGAIRRADPGYDPVKDPDLRKQAAPTDPSPSPPDILAACPMWAILVSVLLLVLRQLVPDLAILLHKSSAGVTAYFKRRQDQELVKLRAELAQIKQQRTSLPS